MIFFSLLSLPFLVSFWLLSFIFVFFLQCKYCKCKWVRTTYFFSNSFSSSYSYSSSQNLYIHVYLLILFCIDSSMFFSLNSTFCQYVSRMCLCTRDCVYVRISWTRRKRTEKHNLFFFSKTIKMSFRNRTRIEIKSIHFIPFRSGNNRWVLCR